MPKTPDGDRFLRPALAVSIAIAIFAVLTQFLAAIGAISLSTTQQLAVWLVAAGLIVLLWMAYMAAGALVTATTAAAKEAADARQAAREQVAQAERAANERVAAARRGRDDPVATAESRAAEARDEWVPPETFRRLVGPEQSVATADVFPDGCYLDSISDGLDYDEKTDTDVVEITRPRRRMYQCKVVDLKRALKDQAANTVVTILTDQKPSLPPGVPHPLVEFDGLTIIPYVTDGSQLRMGYTLRADDVRRAAGQAQEAS
jgi:hypothetical protein